MDAVTKRKSPYPCQESNPARPARSLVTILAELPRLTESEMHETDVYLHGLYCRFRLAAFSLDQTV
jgi:hypothetical protein